MRLFKRQKLPRHGPLAFYLVELAYSTLCRALIFGLSGKHTSAADRPRGSIVREM